MNKLSRNDWALIGWVLCGILFGWFVSGQILQLHRSDISPFVIALEITGSGLIACISFSICFAIISRGNVMPALKKAVAAFLVLFLLGLPIMLLLDPFVMLFLLLSPGDDLAHVTYWQDVMKLLDTLRHGGS